MKFSGISGVLLLGVTSLVSSGCSTVTDIKDDVVKGINDARGGGSSSGYQPARYELTEVPHTLLTKPVAEGRLTSPFGYRRNPTGTFKLPKKHKGIDYAAPAGTPILASGDGVIEKMYVSKSYGNYIRLKHENGFRSIYAHLQEYAPGMVEGVWVRKGQTIGLVGTTGSSTAPHLHYELTYNGQQVDPLFAGN